VSLKYTAAGIPRKDLGQNFLVNGEVVQRILEAARIQSYESVLEIGPGEGALTGELLERAGKLMAVEIDETLFGKLKEKFANFQNLKLIREDILQISFSELARWADSSKLVVVANLPYYITSQLLLKLLDNRMFIDRAILMVQREVGRRIAAAPGSKNYGMLSIMVQLRTEPCLLFDIPPECFRPKPQVHSSLLRLAFHDSPSVAIKNEKIFYRTVKAAFSMRRKMLKNSLRSLAGLTVDDLHTVAAKTGIDLCRRAETLSLGEFAFLSNTVATLLSLKTVTAKQPR
jgi:16S rRNA (adenine1518-N6/adenine1519-N6)-dimethyltransferase